jgi:hypothetical protein
MGTTSEIDAMPGGFVALGRGREMQCLRAADQRSIDRGEIDLLQPTTAVRERVAGQRAEWAENQRAP